MDLEKNIEGVLFYNGEPMKKTALAELFETDPEELDDALSALQEQLSEGALRLVATNDTVQLVTAPELSEIIEKFRKDELRRDIGKAGAETLAIILYRGPVTRAEIDRIRGVNSTFIIRNLLVRGLIERKGNPEDQRSFLYATTTQLMNHLGITKREELPEFTDIMNALDTYEKLEKEIGNERESLA